MTEKLTIEIPINASINDLINLGKYDGVDGNVAENFTNLSIVSTNWKCKLFSSPKPIWSQEVVENRVNRGFVTANAPQILMFGALYPELQHLYTIVGLGSSCLINGTRKVLTLTSDRGMRVLRFSPWGIVKWSSAYHFLFVKPVNES